MGERTNGGIWKLSGAKNFGQISQRSKMLEEFGRSQNVPKLAKCTSSSSSSSTRSGVQGLRCACCIELLCSSVLHCSASKGGAAAFYNWLRSGWNRRVTSSLHTLLLLLFVGLCRNSQHTEWEIIAQKYSHTTNHLHCMDPLDKHRKWQNLRRSIHPNKTHPTLSTVFYVLFTKLNLLLQMKVFIYSFYKRIKLYCMVLPNPVYDNCVYKSIPSGPPVPTILPYWYPVSVLSQINSRPC